jgi:hypothetical protein
MNKQEAIEILKNARIDVGSSLKMPLTKVIEWIEEGE